MAARGSTSSNPPNAGAVGRQQRPSDRINQKTIDPFKEVKNPSVFASVYSSGSIPCRWFSNVVTIVSNFYDDVQALSTHGPNWLVHGSVKHSLSWSQPIETVNFDPTLVLLAEGIRETVHPYCFVARVGFQQLLQVYNARQLVLPVLHKLIPPLRTALSAADDSVFLAGLSATVQLSSVAGPALNPHLKVLLTSVSRHMMNRKHREQITTSLQELEQNGGQECVSIIKSRVPTYSSVLC